MHMPLGAQKDLLTIFFTPVLFYFWDTVRSLAHWHIEEVGGGVITPFLSNLTIFLIVCINSTLSLSQGDEQDG